MPEATVAVAVIRDMVQYVAAKGIDIHQLCGAAQIDPAWLEEPDRHVSGELVKLLWREAIKQTGDVDLGLHIGEAFDLCAIGILGYVLFNCTTYRQVLDKLSQYTCLFSQGVGIHYRVAGNLVECDCEIITNQNNYLLDEPRQPIESTFSALFTATQQLTGRLLPAQSVWFQHPLPENCAEHERIFQTGVEFSQPMNRIVFDSVCLDWAVRSANPKLLSVFEQHAAALLKTQTQGQSQHHKVMQAITQHLQGEAPSIETIARSLMTSVRQLQRDLQAEQTSYQQLLDETRKELALQTLKNPDIAIHNVAFLLGFSEPSAFHRAFKRWTGQTPRTYRASQSDQSSLV